MKMGNSFGFYLVQYLLFIFNVVFLLAGLNLLGMSVWALLDKDYLAVFIKTRLFTAAALFLLCVSVLIIIISFFGCLGSIKGIRWILTLFFLSLLLVLSALLGGVIFMFLYRHSISHQLENIMQSSMKNNYFNKPENASSAAVRDTWDWMQQTLRCCGAGANGSFEWQSTSWFRSAEKTHFGDMDETPKVPESCCVPSELPGFVDAARNQSFENRDKCLGIGAYSSFGGPPITRIVTSQKNEGIYVTGCHRRIINIIGESRYLLIIVSTVVGLIVLIVLGMGLSCNLCRRLEDAEDFFLEQEVSLPKRNVTQ